MNNEIKPKVFTVVSTFTDIGMEVFHVPSIPNITYHDLLNIANYYSVILNVGESKGGLYGPLPVAYHTEYLLYLYTFTIQNMNVFDQRVKENDNIVPSFLLIFFPTAYDGFAGKARNKIAKLISRWLIQFSSIDDFGQDVLAKLSMEIDHTILSEKDANKFSEIEKSTVVIGKSIKLLYNLSQYEKKPVKLLSVGDDDLIFSVVREAIIGKNSKLLTYFKYENNVMDIKLGNLTIRVLNLKENTNIGKFVSNDLNGILYYRNFTTNSLKEKVSKDLGTIIKNTANHCIISVVLKDKNRINLGTTSIPEVLKGALGRTISIIDLNQPNMSIGVAMMELNARVIDVINKNRH